MTAGADWRSATRSRTWKCAHRWPGDAPGRRALGARRPRRLIELRRSRSMSTSGPDPASVCCSCVDSTTQGRMSGYSFDIDPASTRAAVTWYASGAPTASCGTRIARVAPPTPAPPRCSARSAVRVAVDDDQLVASVNGDDVLTVENLPQASIDRGRDAAPPAIVSAYRHGRRPTSSSKNCASPTTDTARRGR